jgi:hypothetical protein
MLRRLCALKAYLNVISLLNAKYGALGFCHLIYNTETRIIYNFIIGVSPLPIGESGINPALCVILEVC